MLSQKDIHDYISFCQLAGSYLELVQGSGGNISVKSDAQMCIKSSGRMLAETTESYGYSLCDLKQLHQLFKTSSLDLKSTVIGGEPNSVPSMETFFHLLPSKWVVHLHPVFLLKSLCHAKWRQLHTQYTHRHIAYYTPGLELAKAIQEQYQGEKILFLKSHGVILCADTIEEVCESLDSLYKEHTSHELGLRTAFHLLEECKALVGTSSLTLRHCNHIHDFNDRLFLPITPDITLFLKQFPLAQETKGDTVSKLLHEYNTLLETLPSVLRIRGHVYVLGKSPKHCVCIEEILESYIAIMRSGNPNEFELFEGDEANALKTSAQEVHRLQIGRAHV